MAKNGCRNIEIGTAKCKLGSHSYFSTPAETQEYPVALPSSVFRILPQKTHRKKGEKAHFSKQYK